MHLFSVPTPDEKGIKATQELFKKRLGKDITTAEALDVLGRVMRFLSNLNFPEKPRQDNPKDL
jgi:hypothetical protein